MIWDYENILSRRLCTWALFSMLAGSALMIFGDTGWRAFGLQSLAWGAIDALIAWFGLQRLQKQNIIPGDDAAEENEASRMRRILWINNALDVLYVAGGTALVYFLGRDNLFWRGTGWGIILQGAFLYVFDLWHALRVPHPLQLPAAPLFTDPKHQPFQFEGQKPAALLVHGFPGTALEMRHIGQRLNQDGWTVRGIRLPGFGEDLAEVVAYKNADWVKYLQAELHTLREKGHNPLLLVGFSFGGGLALQLPSKEHLDGLVLIAPLIWREAKIVKVLADFVRALLPLSVHPLRRIPLDSPQLREEFWQYLPEIDLDNPDHTNELRYLEVPLVILDQIREVGRAGWAAASNITVPTLLIQGEQDNIIRPKWTRSLKDSLGGPVQYTQVDGPHSLTMPHNPAFENVLGIIATFAKSIQSQQKRSPGKRNH